MKNFELPPHEEALVAAREVAARVNTEIPIFDIEQPDPLIALGNAGNCFARTPWVHEWLDEKNILHYFQFSNKRRIDVQPFAHAHIIIPTLSEKIWGIVIDTIGGKHFNNPPTYPRPMCHTPENRQQEIDLLEQGNSLLLPDDFGARLSFGVLLETLRFDLGVKKYKELNRLD